MSQQISVPAMIVAAMRYDFTDDKGKQVTGVKVHYLPIEAESTDESRGHFPKTVSGDLSLFGSIPTPCLALLQLQVKERRDGSFKPRLLGIDEVKPITFPSGK